MVVATFLSLPCLSSRLHRVVWYKLYHLKDARASGNLGMYREMCRNLMPTCDHMRSCNFQTPEIRSSSICMLSRPKNWLFSRHLKVLTWMFRLQCSNLNVPSSRIARLVEAPDSHCKSHGIPIWDIVVYKSSLMFVHLASRRSDDDHFWLEPGTECDDKQIGGLSNSKLETFKLNVQILKFRFL